MGIGGTLLIYGLVGLVIAVAVVSVEKKSGLESAALFAGSLVFWPVFAPSVLARRAGVEGARPDRKADRRFDRQLAGALARLDDLPAGVLAPEVIRVRGLSEQLGAMSARLEEMDRLLASSEFDRRRVERRLSELSSAALENDPRLETLRARLKNIDRLVAMRDRTQVDLERALLMIEELETQVVLLDLAGRPDADLVQHIKEIADGVEGIAEGLWPAA